MADVLHHSHYDENYIITNTKLIIGEPLLMKNAEGKKQPIYNETRVPHPPTKLNELLARWVRDMGFVGCFSVECPVFRNSEPSHYEYRILAVHSTTRQTLSVYYASDYDQKVYQPPYLDELSLNITGTSPPYATEQYIRVSLQSPNPLSLNSTLWAPDVIFEMNADNAHLPLHLYMDWLRNVVLPLP